MIKHTIHATPPRTFGTHNNKLNTHHHHNITRTRLLCCEYSNSTSVQHSTAQQRYYNLTRLVLIMIALFPACCVCCCCTCCIMMRVIHKYARTHIKRMIRINWSPRWYYLYPPVDIYRNMLGMLSGAHLSQLAAAGVPLLVCRCWWCRCCCSAGRLLLDMLDGTIDCGTTVDFNAAGYLLIRQPPNPFISR